MTLLFMEFTGQHIVVTLVVVLAVLLFIKSLAKSGHGCDDACSHCRLHDSCASAKNKSSRGDSAGKEHMKKDGKK